MRDAARHFLAEFIGIFALVFVGSGAIMAAQHLKAASPLLLVATAHGLILSIMVTATMRISGHLNPAVTIGFLAGLVFSPPDVSEAAAGLVPRLAGANSALLAVGMLGATVMPHAVYLHSGLARDRHGQPDAGAPRRRLLRITRYDVGIAMLVAGAVNLAMLLVAATNLQGIENTNSIEGAHAAVQNAPGPTVALFFAIGLLASGLASTSVGAYAGAEIMAGLLRRRIPLLLRRGITLLPALLLLVLGVDPTLALVLSQVALSFGIPFALVPLVWLTAQRGLLGESANRWWTTALAGVAAVLLVGLNVALLALTIAG